MRWVLHISFETVQELEKYGKIKVFKIHNKDFRKDKKEEQKPNLFTKYWLDSMLENNQEIRILPEIDIFKRQKEEQKEQKTRRLANSDKEITEKARIFKDKLYGAFRLEFYPSNKETEVETINDLIKKEYTKQTFYLGIDRGENELASFCLVNSDGQLIKNGCWNEQKTNSHDKGINFAERIKDFYGRGENSIWIKLENARKSISEENNQELKSKEIQKFRELEEQLMEANQLATDFVKNSYCAYLIGEINQILIEYPHTYIVLEDLDIKGRANLETGETNKMQNLEKTMGATVYQAIENAIVNKFKYYTVKTGQFDGQQFVPNISKVEDLRVKDEVKNEDNRGKIRYLKSKDQIGNILFVDEYLTSNECPKCCFTNEKIYKNRKLAKYFEENNAFKLQVSQIIYSFPFEYYKTRVKNILEKYCSSETWDEQDAKNWKILFFPRAKKNTKYMKENKSFEIDDKKVKEDKFHCPSCGFSTTNCNSDKLKNGDFVVKTGDEVAAYNIAKRGLELIKPSKK